MAPLPRDKADQGREEYIESELARRHAADKAAQDSQSQPPQPDGSLSAAAVDPTKHLGERPTMHGKLQEVDLGDEARMRNAAMTEQARRRLAGEAVEEESDGTARKRPRIGKDGKPWRGRKRRASEDVKRDQMVEALMRENRREFRPAQKLCASMAGLLLTRPQSKSTIRPRRQKRVPSLAAAKPRTRGLRRNLSASSWMPWRRGGTSVGRLPLLLPGLE